MRSKNQILTVTKARDIGMMPTYLMLAQRHLEKASPTPELGMGEERTYQIPVDLLTHSGAVPEEMVREIDSIELTYQRKV